MGEMEMWQRCLWALRLEVEPSIANDVEKHVTEKITALRAERDAFERDYTAVGERNAELHAMYMQQAGEVEGLRAALKPYAEMEQSVLWDDHGDAVEVWDAPGPQIAIDALAATTDTKETTDG